MLTRDSTELTDPGVVPSLAHRWSHHTGGTHLKVVPCHWRATASRHFRNHAWEMQRTGEWPKFLGFVSDWLPEIELLNVELLESGHLGIFYREGNSRVPKELAWAGDGIQIWLQLLWHLYKSRDAETIVLDEPEVYLHPDLQRRLVRLLDHLSAQVIMASHSADVIAEAPQNSIVWVDRRTNTSRRAGSDRALKADLLPVGDPADDVLPVRPHQAPVRLNEMPKAMPTTMPAIAKADSDRRR
jgi:hypothetical protein